METFDEIFPGGVDECVAALSDEPSVENPGELCEWLKENGFERIAEADEEIQEVLLSLTVEYVSVVDEPAQDSEWLMAKSVSSEETGETHKWGVPNTPVLVRRKDRAGPGGEEDEVDGDEDSEPERKVWAAVLVPGEADRQGDMVPEPEIESAAHDYLKNYRKVDSDHNLLDGAGVPIESYIVRNGPESFELPNGETREYPEGTWIMGVELSETAWKRVEDGELTGFSIYGGAASLDPDALLSEEVVEAIKAYREKNTDMDGNTVEKAQIDDEEAKEKIAALEKDRDRLNEDIESLKEAIKADPEEGDDEDEESDDDDEDGEQDDENDDETKEKDMGDEPTDDDETNEQNEKLDRILKSVENTEEEVEEVRKSVSSVEDRVSELEEEVYEKDASDEETEETETEETEKNADEEGDYLTEDDAEEVAETAAEKAVEKALGDADENPEEEVVRKSNKNPGGEETVEKSGGPTFDVTNRGVLGGGD